MSAQTQDPFVALSDALAARIRDAARLLVGIGSSRGRVPGILWRPDLIVASEQSLPEQDSHPVTLPGGAEATATAAGRDPGTNVALLRLAAPVADLAAAVLAPPPELGALALVLGAGEAGAATARMAMVRATGPAWTSMAGGTIDRLLKLDVMLGHAEDGGPVIDAAGRLLGMATAGPRGRALVIPQSTIARVIEPLLAQGRIGRGWIGAGLQPVGVPDGLRGECGQKSGLMVMSLAAGGPAEQAGVLLGDILLTLDGRASFKPRAIGALLGADRIGQPIEARLLRAGGVVSQTITVGTRPSE